MNRKECKEMLEKVEEHKELMEWYADGGDVEASLFGEYYYEIVQNPTFALTFSYRKRLNIHQDVKDLIVNEKEKAIRFKVNSKQQSKELQEYLFSIGRGWFGAEGTVKYTEKPFLVIWQSDSGICYSDDKGRSSNYLCVDDITKPILTETDKKIKELEDKIKELKQIREDEKNG